MEFEGYEDRAVIEEWSPEDSVGVLRTLSSGRLVWFCWAFFEEASKGKDVLVGDAAWVEYTPAEQDGYSWRATRVRLLDRP